MKRLEQTATRVLERARQAEATLGCAESCTGGMVAASLTDIAGSSDVFVGGVVSYWVRVKEELLGVDPGCIEHHGVVSEQTALEMAKGACRVLGCDYAVATTGIAGPGGAEPGKPVGTVCFGIAAPHGCTSETMCFEGSRGQVRALASLHALELVERSLPS